MAGIVSFATIAEAQAATIGETTAVVSVAAWDRRALSVGWGVQSAHYVRVPMTGRPVGGQFLSNRGTVLWQLTGTEFHLVQFGSGDDDYASALVNAESFFAAGLGAGRLVLPPTTVRVPRTISFPLAVTAIEGNAEKTLLKPRPGASYTDDVMLRVNVGPDGGWVREYPGPRAGFIGGFQLVNDTDTDIRGIEFGGGYRLGRITARDFNQIAASAPHYTDQVTIEDVLNLAQRPSPPDWPPRKRATIAVGPLGDGLRIKGVHSLPARDEDIADALAIHVRGCRGGVIEGSINGIVAIEDSSAITVLGGHFESGGLLIRESSVRVASTLFFNQEHTRRVPIVTVNDDAVNGDVYTLVLDDVTFLSSGALRYDARDPGRGLPVGVPPRTLRRDVHRASGYAVVVRDCRRSFSRDGTLSQRGRMGIVIGDDQGLVPGWSARAGLLSIAGRIDIDGRARADATSESGAVSAHLRAIERDGFSRWNARGGTWHYACQILHDTARMLGHTVEATATARTETGGGGVLLAVTQIVGATYRFYRGAAGGRYDRMVDVPASQLGYVYDFGDHLNGFPWAPRAAGPVDALAIEGFHGAVTFSGQTVLARFPSAAHDTTVRAGEFQIGDEVGFPGCPRDPDGKIVLGLIRSGTGWTRIVLA